MDNMYRKIPPFKWFVLQNFPFIEEDFDAITNYQLLCKIVEYLNLTIDKTNELGEQVEILSNWFNTLDVQEEIDNKLDEMAQDGTLAEIINQQIFDELNNRITENEEDIGDLERDIENIENSLLNYDTNFENSIIIGDSYSRGYYGESAVTIKSWSEYLVELLGISNYQILDEDGAGFVNVGDEGHTFLTLLQNATITDANAINNIILCAGYNDKEYTKTNLTNAINTFIAYCKTTFPNAKIYLGMISNTSENNSTGTSNRFALVNTVLDCYKSVTALYLNGVENILKNYNYFTDNIDTTHPNTTGQKALGYGIYKALVTGSCDVYYDFTQDTMSISNSNIGDAQNYQFLNFLKHGNMTFLYIPITTIVFTNYVDMDNNYEINLGKLTHSMYRPCSTGINTWNCTFTVGYYDNSNLTYIFCDGFLRVDSSGDLIARLFPTEDNALVRLEDIDNIRITSDTLTTPTILT